MFGIKLKHKSRHLRPVHIYMYSYNKNELFTSKFHDCVTLRIYQLSIIRATWKLLVFVGLFALFTSTRGSLDWRTTWQDLSTPESAMLTSYWLRIFFRDFHFFILFLWVCDANNKENEWWWVEEWEIADKHSFWAQNAYKMFITSRMTRWWQILQICLFHVFLTYSLDA